MLGASAAQISLLFLWFGAVGLVGNVLLTRSIDRIGAATRRGAGAGLHGGIAAGLAAGGGCAGSAMLIIMPWALGCFSSNSAQQARLAGRAGPGPALISLNSSAMYLGQFAGAASGGAMIAASGFAGLHWVALAWMSAGDGLSLWAARRMRGGPRV